MAMTLEALLQPIGLEAFFRQCWNRRAAALAPSWQPAIVDPERWFLGLLDSGAAMYPTVRVSAAHGDVDPLVFTKSTGSQFDPRIRPERIRELLAKSAGTLRISDIGALDECLGEACRELSDAFGCEVTANGYFTPPGVAPIRTHFDAHHVIALQLAGSKEWSIGPMGYRNPLPATEIAVSGPPDLPSRVLVLAGSAVYLPPGQWHRAQVRGSFPSVHIAFGIKPPSWHGAMREAVDAAAQAHWILRGALPMRVADGRCEYVAPAGTEVAQAFALVGAGFEAAALLAIRPAVAHTPGPVPVEQVVGRPDPARVAGEIWRNTTGPISVFMRGSYVDPGASAHPWDIDVVVLSSHADPRLRRGDEERMRERHRQLFPSLPPLDVTVTHAEELVGDEDFAIKRHLLVEEGVLLLGEPLPERCLDAADPAAIRRRSEAIARKKLGELAAQDAAQPGDPLVARRAAKAALRLIGAFEFVPGAKLERRPQRCMALASGWPAPARGAAESLFEQLGADVPQPEVTARDAQAVMRHLALESGSS